MMDILQVLNEKVEQVAPIFGVSLGETSDKSTWRIDFKPEATPAQRTAAQAVVDAFDVAAEEQKLKDAEQAKVDKKALLLTLLNKPVTVQDLLDLGLL